MAYHIMLTVIVQNWYMYIAHLDSVSLFNTKREDTTLFSVDVGTGDGTQGPCTELAALYFFHHTPTPSLMIQF